MSAAKTKTAATELEEDVIRYQVARGDYYNTGKSDLTDAEFDELEESIRERDPLNPILSRVGAPLPKDTAKVQLPVYMGSLDKSKNMRDVTKWLAKNATVNSSFVVMDKLDGISVLLVYRRDTNLPTKYTYTSAYKRGDGVCGMVITKHIAPIVSEELTIPKKTMSTIAGGDLERKNLYIRCELVGNVEKLKSTYVSSKRRNYVNGLVSKKTLVDPAEIIANTRLVMFEAHLGSTTLTPKCDQLKFLAALKKTTENMAVIPYTTFDDGEVMKSALDDLIRERLSDTECDKDGLVIAECRKGGEPGHIATGENPSNQLAYKNLTGLLEQATAVVDRIEWNLSKDLLYKPRVWFVDPVQLEGATVAKATGKNYAHLKKVGLGVGSQIVVIRAGKVIPDIESVITTSDNLCEPEGSVVTPSGVDLTVAPEALDTDVIKATIATKNLVAIAKVLGIARSMNKAIIGGMVKKGVTDLAGVKSLSCDEFVELSCAGATINRWTAISEAVSAVTNKNLLDIAVEQNAFGKGVGKKTIMAVYTEIPFLMDEFDTTDLHARMIGIKGVSTKTAEKLMTGIPIARTAVGLK